MGRNHGLSFGHVRFVVHARHSPEDTEWAIGCVGVESRHTGSRFHLLE